MLVEAEAAPDVAAAPAAPARAGGGRSASGEGGGGGGGGEGGGGGGSDSDISDDSEDFSDEDEEEVAGDGVCFRLDTSFGLGGVDQQYTVCLDVEGAAGGSGYDAAFGRGSVVPVSAFAAGRFSTTAGVKEPCLIYACGGGGCSSGGGGGGGGGGDSLCSGSDSDDEEWGGGGDRAAAAQGAATAAAAAGGGDGWTDPHGGGIVVFASLGESVVLFTEQSRLDAAVTEAAGETLRGFVRGWETKQMAAAAAAAAAAAVAWPQLSRRWCPGG
jgi:hypothetical protein